MSDYTPEQVSANLLSEITRLRDAQATLNAKLFFAEARAERLEKGLKELVWDAESVAVRCRALAAEPGVQGGTVSPLSLLRLSNFGPKPEAKP